MVTGSLQDIFRFKFFRRLKFSKHVALIVVFTLPLCVLGFFPTQKVYAGKWFATYGGGVLSGGTATFGIINGAIPKASDLLIVGADFNPDVVQHIGPNSRTTYGSLISRTDQDVKNGSGDTDDASVKNTGVVMTNPSYFSTAHTISGSGYVESNCASLNMGSIDPLGATGKVYKVPVSCMESAIAGTYNLSDSGLAVIFVYDDGSDSILDVNAKLVSSDSTPANIDKERILIVTDAKVKLENGAKNASPNPLFNAPPDLQASFVTTYATGNSYESDNASGNPFIIEGPITGSKDIKLGANPSNDFSDFFVKYNPFYVAELSKAGVGANHFNVKGLMESKITWRYD